MAHIGDRLRSLIVLLSRGWVKGWGIGKGEGGFANRCSTACLFVCAVCVFMPEILDINSHFIGR